MEEHSSYQQFLVHHESSLNKIYDYLHNFMTKPASHTPVVFQYHGVCENMLAEVFSKEGYLNLDNSVFYVTLVYNLLTIIEKKLRKIKNSGQTLHQSEYVQNYIFPLIEIIDRQISNPAYSILYLGLNSFVEPVYNSKQDRENELMFAECAIAYYHENSNKSPNLLKCLSSNEWHPEKLVQEAKLSSVIRLEYFDLQNPIYQLKYVGCLY